jgi:hypothetical protein
MDLIRVTPDKERVRSILKMISLIKERIGLQDRIKMTALIISDYYEIIKELITSLLLLDGFKTLSHKDLLEYLKINYNEFNEFDILILNNLRMLRNRVAYEGYSMEVSYLDKNENNFKLLIDKLDKIISVKLN